MESLGDILKRMAAREFQRTFNGDRAGLRSIAPDENEETDCPICNGAGWVSKRVPVGHPDFGEAFPCRCQQRQDTEQRTHALSRYSNLGALRRTTFENTRPEGILLNAAGSSLFREALAAAEDFSEDPKGWMVFSGPSGSGKTHLAVAIANRCIEQGLPTYFIVAADLLDHLRATYAPDSDLSYDELFEHVRNAPLLVLDDLSAQVTTPWAKEKLFQIISHRFNESLPTIITVRGSLDRLDEGLRTRMESQSDFSRVFRLGENNSRLSRRIGAMPEEMQLRMTLDSFDVYGRADTDLEGRESLARALEAAREFAVSPSGWLLLTGPRGCGKTHLAAAILGESERQGRQAFYAFVPSLLDHLRGTFSPDSLIAYDELFEEVKTVPLLVLDDLGTESSTPWAEEKLYQIVVYRYDARLPTIITSVFNIQELEAMKPRIGSRLVDGTMVDWHPITAPNYRDQRRK
ncbi:MAG: ATP-binding protein [Chloroflexota bacterium]|nr:ATP-binding protein [Chloroflexota bacterium]